MHLVRAGKEGEVEMDWHGHRDLRNEDLILKEAEEQVEMCDNPTLLFKLLKRRKGGSLDMYTLPYLKWITSQDLL